MLQGSGNNDFHHNSNSSLNSSSSSNNNFRQESSKHDNIDSHLHINNKNKNTIDQQASGSLVASTTDPIPSTSFGLNPYSLSTSDRSTTSLPSDCSEGDRDRSYCSVLQQNQSDHLELEHRVDQLGHISKEEESKEQPYTEEETQPLLQRERYRSTSDKRVPTSTGLPITSLDQFLNNQEDETILSRSNSCTATEETLKNLENHHPLESNTTPSTSFMDSVMSATTESLSSASAASSVAAAISTAKSSILLVVICTLVGAGA